MSDYVYTLHTDDTSTYDSVSELIENNDLLVGDTYYRGVTIPVEESKIAKQYSKHLIEQIDDWMCEELGECYDPENPSIESVVEFTKFLESWLAKYTNISRYFKIAELTEFKVTQQDMDDL